MESNSQNGKNHKIQLFDYLIVLLKWKKTLIIVFLVSSIVSVAVSLILPKWYTSTATILPPKNPDILSFMGSAASTGTSLKNLAMSALGSGIPNAGGYNYMAILESRETAQNIINKFNIREVYGLDKDTPWEDVVKALNSNVSFDLSDDGYISISVEDKDSVRAAEMANYYVKILNQRSYYLGSKEAHDNRVFVEKLLSENTKKLSNFEDSLKTLFQNNNFILLPEQNASTLSAYADLYAQKFSIQVKLQLLKNRLNPDDNLIKQTQQELNTLNNELSKLPATGVSTMRIYRKLLIQEKIVEFLTPVLEQAKIDEQKNIPVVLVLDKAIPAQKKSWPRRSLIVIITVILSMGATILIIFIREKVTYAINNDPHQKMKYNRVKELWHSSSKE